MANAQLLRDARLRESLSRRFPRWDQSTKRILVQTIVLSRPSQHPLQIASVHGGNVLLGPCGYTIVDDGCKRAVGLVSEPAAELIIIIIIGIIIAIAIIIVAVIIIMGTIIIIIIIIVAVVFA
jgi:hypothetical protein